MMHLNTKNKTIPIHETFQQTIQGEGYFAGTPCDFIRLAGCPVHCHYCDTGYGDTKANTDKHLPRSRLTFEQLINQLISPRVIISGGEPFIHQELPELVEVILAHNKSVAIETSGCFWQDIPPTTWITLSPKGHINPQYPVLPILWQRANEVKLVIETGEELEYYAPQLSQLNIPIFLQPEWDQGNQTLPLVLQLLRKNPQYRLSVQLHKYLNIP